MSNEIGVLRFECLVQVGGTLFSSAAHQDVPGIGSETTLWSELANSVIRTGRWLVVLGGAVLLAFSILDGLYLHNEQKFRDLYDAIVRNEVPPFSMKLSEDISSRTRNRSYFSWSITFFYGPLLVAGLLLAILALSNDDDPGRRYPDGGEHGRMHQSERPGMEISNLMPFSNQRLHP